MKHHFHEKENISQNYENEWTSENKTDDFLEFFDAKDGMENSLDNYEEEKFQVYNNAAQYYSNTRPKL